MARRYIDCENIEKLAKRYMELGGNVCDEAIPGTLGYGTTIMVADGYKSAVIQEHFETSWSCYHTIRFYNRLPKKYQKLVDDYPYIIEERGW